MKPVALFTIADSKHKDILAMFVNSLRKFHTEEELPLIVIGDDEIKKYNDPNFFYRATPIIANELLSEYELVIKADCDQIVMGRLDHIYKDDFDWDVATVLNINRIDPSMYGNVTCCNIPPQQYYNCGLVAMKSKRFVQHWLNLCYSEHFGRFQFREQDLLNILCHFGEYQVKCLDRADAFKEQTWNGLVAKGEGVHMYLDDKGRVILPRGEDGYPDRNVIVKLYHFAGGNNEAKMNYRTHFNEDMIKYIAYLVSEEKK